MRKVNLLSAVCWYILYWLYQLPLLHGKLTLVQRNQIDSFRIGDGCDSNVTVCRKYKAYCYENKCLCDSGSPHFRNPIIVTSSSYQYGSSYGCITDEELRRQRLDNGACSFIPEDTSLLPHGPTTTPTSITYDGQRNYTYCNLIKVEVKYPDSNDWFNVQPWLNNSYFDFSLQKMEFKWTKPVAELQGSIIMIFFNCVVSSTATQECLQAKVQGTWAVNNKAVCSFIPKDNSLLPHGPTTMPTSITYDGQRNYEDCNLIKVEVKYPDSNDWFDVPWLNNSYFDFSLQKMEFKWTKPVAELQGSIIMIFLNCITSSTATQECLQAKIEGTWTSKVLISKPAPTSILAETVTTRYPGSTVPTEIHHSEEQVPSTSILAETVTTRYPGSTVPTKVYHSEQPRISSPSTKPPSSITSETHEETSDTWKNVSIALLVIFPVIIFILILFYTLQIKRKRREPETVNPTTNSVYDYPNASFYENSNQTTDNHSYNEPADVNQNSHKDPSSVNELSHYQSLQRENMEEQNTYQHLVKPI